MSKNEIDVDDYRIRLVSIPDGLELDEDRADIGKFHEAMCRVMPVKLQELIENMKNEGNKIACVVAEGATGWAFEIAKNMGIKGLAFYPASATTLAVFLSIPKFTEDGIIDNNGTILKKGMIHLSATMPAIKTETFGWACISDIAAQKSFFQFLVENNKFLKFADFIICNTAYELEPETFSLFPEILPVGALSASSKLGNQACNFWAEDYDCLSWLDQQPACSIIYAAFGSFTVFDQTQFQELASGLELTNKPFLWVLRPGMTNEEAFLQEFEARIGSRGKIVSWAPQEKVLSHPSVACFMSHCGWNSITEGLSNGVPFLCWPYICDQFLNETYICDVWKVGLGFEKDETGIIRKAEVKNKVEQLLGDINFKSRAVDLKERIRNSVQDGRSFKNFGDIIEWMRST
ncbi:putative UDP-glucuronosyl/UDP-glucosyltransferase [Heracleum sosnowskyi]|uniref:UDP-glucuronosyl/UDP-glucosyltransferase n=1 Tax=Heracleum sosnowskyi TaxID=360622 RepID=A0AAD8MR81_9APIA|nr:putative UDP-glucuronosyl/UDP-glucosyltransferase [Heracleum sosnowskyi]